MTGGTTGTVCGFKKGTTFSGNVTSFGASGSNLNLQLIPSGSQEAVFEADTDENNSNFSFSGVEAGTYTVVVSKENHVTREYEVTVGTEPINLDVKLHLVGDITGDGEITSKDKKLIYSHINDPSKFLTGYEYDVADVSGEGELTSKDKKMLYNHLNDPSKSLWS